MARGAKGAKFGALGFSILSVIMAGLTIVLLARLMSGTKYAGEAVQEVVVAAKNIEAATRITEDHLKVAKWPISSVPEGSFSSIDQLLAQAGAKVAISKMYTGEPVLVPRLASAAKGTGMASLVTGRMRAMSVTVDDWLVNSRIIYPRAYVDVVATIKNPETRRSTTRLVLQNLQVLAVNGITDPSGMDGEKKKGTRSKSVITLLVDPHESEVLTFATREGKIDLVLRNSADKEIEPPSFGVSPALLLGLANPDEVEAAEAELAAGRMAAKATQRRRSRPRRRVIEKTPNKGGPDNAFDRRSRTKTINLGAQ